MGQDGAEAQGQDEPSKPVSSLRSHFENLNNPRANTSFTVAAKPKSLYAVDDGHNAHVTPLRTQESASPAPGHATVKQRPSVPTPRRRLGKEPVDQLQRETGARNGDTANHKPNDTGFEPPGDAISNIVEVVKAKAPPPAPPKSRHGRARSSANNSLAAAHIDDGNHGSRTSKELKDDSAQLQGLAHASQISAPAAEPQPPPIPHASKPKGTSDDRVFQKNTPILPKPTLPPRFTDASALSKASSSPQPHVALRNSSHSTASSGTNSPLPPKGPAKISSSSSSTRSHTPVTDRLINQPSQKVDMIGEDHSFPDISQINRRLPVVDALCQGIACPYECKAIDISGELICAGGVALRVWSVVTGKLVLSLPQPENIKVTAIAFKPSREVEKDGMYIWFGNNYGELCEVDIEQKKVRAMQRSVHARREVVRIIRSGMDLWSIDNEGKVYVWPAGANGTPTLEHYVLNAKVPRGHTASTSAEGNLWLATGRDIHVFTPSADNELAGTKLTDTPMTCANASDILSVAISSIENSPVIFGHTDGRVSWYCSSDLRFQGVVQLSTYRVSSLVVLDTGLWAGFGNGSIGVYDYSARPWTLIKEWKAHQGPVVGFAVHASNLWKLDSLPVMSLGVDNYIGVWDGLLELDFQDRDTCAQEDDYCQYRDISALVVTWNAAARKPSDISYRESDSRFFQELFAQSHSPELIIVGLQELVDLDDKKLTAKNLIKGRNRDAYGQEQLGSVYRDWRDYLSKCVDRSRSSHDADGYVLLHTSSLVGLFSCVFAKASERHSIKQLAAAEIKTGMGGLYGNKGALLVRMCLDDTTICFANCHLAAGQTATLNRNEDVSSILEAGSLAPLHLKDSSLLHGGNGSLVLDHEIAVLSGDLNYRIDTMGRDTVINAIDRSQYHKLLDRDQLTLSRRKNPSFKLRAFQEGHIDFAPTYKYDPGTDRYDSSEKRRVPAWCDRILYRGGDKIEQQSYERHEFKASDHRPVTAMFKIRVRAEDPDEKAAAREISRRRFRQWKSRHTAESKILHLRSAFGLSRDEAEERLSDG